LYSGDKQVGEGHVEHPVPVGFSSFDGLDVGFDSGSSIDFTYKPPYTSTGKLDEVKVDLN
jgi:hypothetical protein